MLLVNSSKVRLFALNCTVFVVVISALILVMAGFTEIRRVFEVDVENNLRLAVKSFDLGKSLIRLELEIHHLESNFVHDPEGMIAGRRDVLSRFDTILHEVRTSRSFFRKGQEYQQLKDYRDSLATRMADNVKISELALELDLKNQIFISKLNRMEEESSLMIMEQAMIGFDSTGLRQSNALIPFCRELVLRARFLMEKSITDLNPLLLVADPGQIEGESMAETMDLFHRTLNTMTSAQNEMSHQAGGSILADLSGYQILVNKLADIVGLKAEHNKFTEKKSQAILASLSRIDRQTLEVLRDLGWNTKYRMAKAANTLYIIVGIVLVVLLICGGFFHLIVLRLVRQRQEVVEFRDNLQRRVATLKKELELCRRAEQQILATNRSLEHLADERGAKLATANRELESLVLAMSHDLRTPLRGIAGFSHALHEDYGEVLNEEGRSYLERVQEGCIRMGATIDDMLELARLTKVNMVMVEVDLSAISGSVVEELRRNYPDRRVQVDIAPGLKVRADAQMMRVMMDNLLGNAWKFTSGKDEVRISVGRDKMDGRPVFYVRDNGVGFNMAYCDKIFGAFQRLHSLDQFEGAGMGLAVVQRIIHRHQGEVWAQGREGKGASFYFRLGGSADNN